MTTPPGALLPTTVRTLDHLIAAEQSERRLPSVAAGLVRDGRLVWEGAAGTTGAGFDRPPLPSTRYRIGSITKSFVAAGVVQAREDGLVDLEDRLERHLPDVPDLGHLSVGQLLGQASGLQAETDGPWWERAPGGDWASLRPLLSSAALRHRPGVRFHYSNVGSGVLGELLSRLRGAPWHEVVAERLLQPLGMTATTLRRGPDDAQGYAVHPWADAVLAEPEHDAGAMAPAGQLWSTVADLARWSRVVVDGAGVLSPASVRAMREPQVVDDPRAAAWSAGYGLGLQLWNVAGRRSAGHSGSMPGFVALLRVDELTSDAVVAVTNSTTGFADLPARLLAALDAAEPHAPRPWVPRRVAEDVLALVGPWYWGPAPLVLRSVGEGVLDLAGLAGPGRAARFAAVGDGTWRGLDGYYAGELLRVVAGPDGSPHHLDLASFRLTRTPYPADADVPGGVDAAGWTGPRG